MNLYLISQDENTGYDTYDSAVVCAPDEETARGMDPQTGEPVIFDPDKRMMWDWCSSPDKVKVKLIGLAMWDLPQGVVCSSYNAG